MLDITEENYKIKNIRFFFEQLIKQYIENHKLSQSAHEEIMAMIHSDKDVSFYYYKREMDMTYKITDILKNNNYILDDLNERVHLIIGIIDNLCHEVIYHKHQEMNYDVMTKYAINCIVDILESK